MQKSIRFFIIMLPAFLARVKPVSTMAKPHCIKNTKIAPIKNHTVISVNTPPKKAAKTSAPNVRRLCRPICRWLYLPKIQKSRLPIYRFQRKRKRESLWFFADRAPQNWYGNHMIMAILYVFYFSFLLCYASIVPGKQTTIQHEKRRIPWRSLKSWWKNYMKASLTARADPVHVQMGRKHHL